MGQHGLHTLKPAVTHHQRCFRQQGGIGDVSGRPGIRRQGAQRFEATIKPPRASHDQHRLISQCVQCGAQQLGGVIADRALRDMHNRGVVKVSPPGWRRECFIAVLQQGAGEQDLRRTIRPGVLEAPHRPAQHEMGRHNIKQPRTDRRQSQCLPSLIGALAKRSKQHRSREPLQQAIANPTRPRIVWRQRKPERGQGTAGQGQHRAAQLNPRSTGPFRPPGAGHQKAVANQQFCGTLLMEAEQILSIPLAWPDEKRGEIKAQLVQAMQAVTISLQVIRHQLGT